MNLVPRLPVRPVSGLMDRRFIYIPAAATDIRATFARVKANNPLPLKAPK
jgi:hypothetical protein